METSQSIVLDHQAFCDKTDKTFEEAHKKEADLSPSFGVKY